GGDGGGGGGGGDAALTTKQIQWYGHEAAFTGVSLPLAIDNIVQASLFAAEGEPEGSADCVSEGQVSWVHRDVDGSGEISAGDTLALDFSNCLMFMENLPVDGPVELTVGELEGSLEGDDWALPLEGRLGE